MISSPYENFDLYEYFMKLVRQIPEGKVSSYREIANALGDTSAAVACAYMQAVLKKEELLPLHRLIRATGELGGYYDLEEIRENSALLREEGLTVRSGRVKFLKDAIFDDFETNYPLEKMKEEQNKMAAEVSLEDDYDQDLIGAVDVSYNGMKGYGSMVFREDGDLIETDTEMRATFPYIPGYLFYREYRFIKQLARHFRGTLLIDGNGLLHPRLFGLASAAGVFMDKATVGVAKSLLLGKVRRNWVLLNDIPIGYVVEKRTIVSPGHRISLDSSVDLIKSNYDNTYPEILKVAHNNTVRLRVSREEVMRAREA